MSANVPELSRELGIPEINVGSEEFHEYVLPAAIAGFIERDIIIYHGGDFTGRAAELFGESAFHEGEVAQRMLASAIAAGQDHTTNIYILQHYAVDKFLDPDGDFADVSNHSIATIRPTELTVDNLHVPLDRPPRCVMEFGACSSSRSITTDQMNFLAYGERPFGYMPITRTHFMNRVIMEAYNQYGLGPELLPAMVASNAYIGREDGIANFTATLLQGADLFQKPSEVADIILAISQQHTTADEMKLGLARAYKILKKGGTLVVHGLVQPEEDEIGTEGLKEIAYENGFDEGSSVTSRGKLSEISSILQRGHVGDLETETVAIRK